jgi:putative ABC transport system permease protein
MTMRPLRFALRQLSRSPAFALTVILTLAIGIGAGTLIFSVVDGVLLAPLPYAEPERIVDVAQISERGGRVRVSDPNFADLKEQTRSLESFAEYAAYYAVAGGTDEPVRAVVADVSAEFFDVFRVQPALGRTFVPEEQVFGAAPVALVSYSFWQRYLGGTPDFAARTLRFEDRAFAIVGVMPRGFDFPGADVWRPRESLWPAGGRTAHNFHAVGRLAPNVSLDAARSDFSAVARRLKIEHGADTFMVDADVTTILDQVVAKARLPLLMLSAAAVLLYAIAIANVVNLLLARAVARQRELATRLALGARRATLARGFFAEALVLCTLGAAAGLLGAWWGVRPIALLDSGLLPRAASIHVGAASVAVAAVLALLAAAGSSLLVAWRASGDAGALQGGRRATASRSGARLRNTLVAAQVGIAAVLAVGAALLGRSYAEVTDVDPGFRADGMLLMEVIAPYSRENRAAIREFHDRMLEGLRALPGTETVGAVSSLPLRGAGTNGLYLTLNRPDEVRDFDAFAALAKQPGRTGFAEYRVANDDYFATLGIPLLRGRTFQASDTPDATHAAVVSRSLAEASWPGEDAIGKLIQFGGMDGDLTPFTVVGVVGDIRDYGLDRAARPTFYASYRQRPTYADSLWFALRAPNAQGLTAAAREIVRGISPDAPPTFLTSEQLYAESIAQRRFNLVMLGTFGGAALLLALTGVYGAIAFGVAQRRHEIGLRIALGATVGRVIASVLRHSLAVAALGVAAGLVVAFAGARVVSSLLYGVAPHDPLSYAIATALLLAAAGGAALIPALRAARIDAVETLRDD